VCVDAEKNVILTFFVSVFMLWLAQTPKRRTSSLGKRLRGQIAAAFAKPGQPPLAATNR
jgi:hypothetical protein